MKFLEAWDVGPRNSGLDFGGDLGHNPGPEIFKGSFIYYFDSCRQPRIKSENPQQRFELVECFLVTNIIDI